MFGRRLVRAALAAIVVLVPAVPAGAIADGTPQAAAASESIAQREAAIQSQLGEASRDEVVALAQWQAIHDRRVALDHAVAEIDARVAATQRSAAAAQRAA